MVTLCVYASATKSYRQWMPNEKWALRLADFLGLRCIVAAYIFG